MLHKIFGDADIFLSNIKNRGCRIMVSNNFAVDPQFIYLVGCVRVDLSDAVFQFGTTIDSSSEIVCIQKWYFFKVKILSKDQKLSLCDLIFLIYNSIYLSLFLNLWLIRILTSHLSLRTMDFTATWLTLLFGGKSDSWQVVVIYVCLLVGGDGDIFL